jgi:hypothetical protein
MTGFFTISRGLSFLKASPMAGTRIFVSKMETDFGVIKVSEIGM